MNVAIISDVHLETWYKGREDAPFQIYKVTNCDTLVIAGDFGYPFNTKGKQNQRFIDVLKKLKHIYQYILYVPGNHEYYNTQTLEQTDQMLKKICFDTGVIFLQTDIWEHPVSKILFVGCTLWSTIKRQEATHMNDFNRVFGMDFEACVFQHESHKSWLNNILDSLSHRHVLLVTHHLPSEQLMSCPHSGYASSSEFFIRSPPVIGWICGHVHKSIDAEINNIPIKSNPFDYKHLFVKKSNKYKMKCFTFPIPLVSPFTS